MSVIRLFLDDGTPDQRAEEAMIEICCDAMEGAIAAAIVCVNAVRGTPYLRAANKFWAIRYCPFCGRGRRSTQRGTRLKEKK